MYSTVHTRRFEVLSYNTYVRPVQHLPNEYGAHYYTCDSPTEANQECPVHVRGTPAVRGVHCIVQDIVSTPYIPRIEVFGRERVQYSQVQHIANGRESLLVIVTMSKGERGSSNRTSQISSALLEYRASNETSVDKFVILQCC